VSFLRQKNVQAELWAGQSRNMNSGSITAAKALSRAGISSLSFYLLMQPYETTSAANRYQSVILVQP
jgi:hypothetical protein